MRGIVSERSVVIPDGWGVLIAKADSAEEYFKAFNMWRMEGTGFFKTTKTVPALSVRGAMANTEEMLEEAAA